MKQRGASYYLTKKHMKKGNNWKVPIYAETVDAPYMDLISEGLMSIIWKRARRKPETDVFWCGKKEFIVYLKVGQMVLNLRKISRETGVPRKRLNRSLIDVQIFLKSASVQKGAINGTIGLEFEQKRYGLLVTVNNYLDVVQLSSSRNHERNHIGTTVEPHRNHIGATSHESDYSAESVKSEEPSSTAREVQKIPVAEKLDPWIEASNIIGLTPDLHGEMQRVCMRRPNIDPVLVAHKVMAKHRNVPGNEKYLTFQNWFYREFEPEPLDPDKQKEKEKGPYWKLLEEEEAREKAAWEEHQKLKNNEQPNE